MASRVFATVDLVRLIYSFGDPSHRKFTHDLKWDLRPWPEVVISRYTERRLTVGCHSYYIQDYLDEFSNHKLEHMLRTFRRCYCCQRHNTDKPMIYCNEYMTPQTFVFESVPDLDCNCSCRSLSRKCIQAIQYRVYDSETEAEPEAQ
jgi:hypothetical protein